MSARPQFSIANLQVRSHCLAMVPLLPNRRKHLGNGVVMALGPHSKSSFPPIPRGFTHLVFTYGVYWPRGRRLVFLSAKSNARAYGPNTSARDIAFGTTPVTMSAEAQSFTNALGRNVRATSGTKN